MKKLKNFVVTALAVLSTASFVAGISLQQAAAQVQETTHGQEVTYGQKSFTTPAESDFYLVNDNGNTDFSATINFNDCTTDYASTVIYNQELTGEYYTEFFISDVAASHEFASLRVAFGNDSAEWSNDNSVVVAITAANMQYPEDKEYVLPPANRDGWLVNCYVRFAVNSDGNIDIYQEKTPIDLTIHAPRGQVKLKNADFSLTNGYFGISSGRLQAVATEKSIYVQGLRVDCPAERLSAEEDVARYHPEDLILLGDNTALSRSMSIVDKDASQQNITMFKSGFEINDQNAIQDEKIFEMTFSMYRDLPNGQKDNTWGIVFGLSETQCTIPPNNFVAFRYNNFLVGSKNATDVCAYRCRVATDVTIKGYKGGTVIASYSCEGNFTTKECPKNYVHTLTATGLDLNGQFAIATWGGFHQDAKLEVKNFTFTGKTCHRSGVDIYENKFANVKAGERVHLFDKARVAGGYYSHDDLVWQKIAGVGNITDGVFTTDTVGSTTLRASLNGTNLYSEITFENQKPDHIIEINEGILSSVAVGDKVTLEGKYYTNPYIPVTDDVTYSIVAGSDVVALEDNVLTAQKSGSATLRVTSVNDTTYYKDYTFEVSSLERFEIAFNEPFDNLETGRWTAMNMPENGFYTNKGAYFSNSFNNPDDPKAIPKLVYNIPLTSNANTGMVFDISFIENKLLGINNQDTFFGFMFGMPTKDAHCDDENVGYLKFTKTLIEVYHSGKKISSTKLIETPMDFAYNFQLPVKVRVVGYSDGTLELYVGKEYSMYKINVEDLYARYEGFNLNNTYVSFFTNVDKAKEGERNNDFSIRVSNVNVFSQTMLDADCVQVQEVVYDDSALQNLFAIANPVPIDYYILANYNISAFTEGEIKIISGQAEVKGNSIVFNTPGKVTFRIVSKFDNSKYKDVTVDIKQLDIEKITIKTEKFENVTIDTQPIDLIATVKANTYLEKYLAVTFSVVSGKAEIVHKQLRILGTGDVTIRATSNADPTKYAEFTFTVSNADAELNVVQPNDNEKSFSCNSVVYTSPVLLVVVISGIFIFMKKKKDA